VRFVIEQRFGATPADVQRALLDPDVLTGAAQAGSHPKLGRPVFLGQSVDGDVVRQQVRYAFTGDLSSAVRAVVDPARLTWVQDTTTDLSRHRSTFTIVPDHYRAMLSAGGIAVLRDDAGRGCVRRVEGTVDVSVLLVGRKVEAAIVSGLREHAAAEVEAIDAWLGPEPAG
jgi:hypothetical protein